MVLAAPIAASRAREAYHPRRGMHRGAIDKRVTFTRLDDDKRAVEDVDSARLVTRVQAGDRDAFAALYRRYFGPVFAYFRVALNDVHQSEDAAQQVFVKVLEAIGGYERRRQPFRAWLFTIARNHAIDLLKAGGRLELMEPVALDELREAAGEDEEDAAVLKWITDADLAIFIERLPLVQRQVLLLRFLMGLKADEVARALGRTSSDVRVLQSRALRFLRARLTAIGRAPEEGADRRNRAGVQRRFRQAPVLRMRRYSLGEEPGATKRRW
jgi:RNA polymerase sigma-70 factor (ECF subfamily)